ncbi:hypothetical protein AAG570_011151 [Ranatra chinensis]|uniref:Dynein assembly factor 3, axonemal n=1 Tax=Ranatra chinensis TaxID=642074 RepID=A0ABD0Z822_9HEMI
MFWGFSPAIDFLHEMDKTLLEGRKELNILLVGAADARHILQTMARYYVNNQLITINYFIIEVVMELIARQMLLLVVALEPKEKLGLAEKARLWMELYGNTLLRHSSYEYLVNKSVQLIHMVTDIKFLARRMPTFNLSQLKYREKDILENIFRFWSVNTFDTVKLWDERVRKSLGVRYDSKEGAFDWDYSMKLKDISGASVINSGEFKKWRRIGIAFSWLETEANSSNPTLACGVVLNGDKLHHMGYMGDIRAGPFFTFGLKCDDADMMKTYNGVHIKRSSDIFERNLMRIFYEIENQAEYEPDISEFDPNLGVSVVADDLPEASDVINLSGHESSGLQNRGTINKAKEDYSCLPGPEPGQSITFLPRNALTTHPHKVDYQNHFQAIFIAHNILQYVTSDLFNMADKGAVIVFESIKFCIGISKEEVVSHQKRIEKLAEESNCDPIGNFDPFINEFAFFKIKK